MGASPRVSSRLVFGGWLGVGSCRRYAAARVSCAFRLRASALSRCLHDVVSSVVLRGVLCLVHRHRASGGSVVEACCVPSLAIVVVVCVSELERRVACGVCVEGACLACVMMIVALV